MKLKIAILTLFISTGFLFGQKTAPLFESDKPLKITIRSSLRKVISDVSNREERPALLTIEKEDGTLDSLTIKLRIRGVTRAKKEVCQFPPLRLNFKKKQTKNTVFEGQNKLKLVTHCANSKNYSQNTLKEYLAYKLYEVITPYSFKVRLCEITYIDSQREDRSFKQIGFIIEDVDELAKRNGMKEYDGRIINQEALQKETLDKMTVFQYLIGNLDWAVPNRHNLKVIAGTKGKLPIGVPYDFDFSGWVNALYAKPPDKIDISSVRIRVFRGICRINQYKPTIDFYKKKRTELEAEISKTSFLTEKSENYIRKYFNDFYEILKDPNQASKKIITACRAEHQHTFSK